MAEVPERPDPPAPRRAPRDKVVAKDDQKRKAPEEEDRLDSIINSVLKNAEKKEPTPRPQPAQAQLAGRPQTSALQQREVALSIRNQLKRCWRIEPGAREAESLIIEMRVRFHPDGEVRTAEILDGERLLTDAFFRSAAENARRAVLQCSPYSLPLDSYSFWQQVTLVFDPREMFGL